MGLFFGLSIAVAFSAPGYLTLPGGKEPFERLHGWREIARATEGFLATDSYSAVIGPHRHVTAQLVYYLRKRPQKVFAFHQSGPPHDHYELTRPYRGIPKGPVLLVSTSEKIGRYEPFFETISLVGQVDISSGNIAKLWFYSLDGYRPSIDSKAASREKVSQ